VALLGGSRAPRKVQQLTGLVNIYVRRGKLVARRWPAKRGRAKTPYAQGLQDRMGEVSKHIKNTFWLEVKTLREALQRWRGKSTGLKAGAIIRERDWMTRVAYGRMFAIELENGRVLWPEQVAIDVSDALDWLEPRFGSLMVRTSETWLPTHQCQVGWIFQMTPDGILAGACPPASIAGPDESVGVYES